MKTTFNFVLGFLFSFVSISAFAQSNENIILLEMPKEQIQTTNETVKVAFIETTSKSAQETIVSSTPIYVADGVVISNLNTLDPSTIISVDVVANKIIITTNKTKTIESPTLAANF